VIDYELDKEDGIDIENLLGNFTIAYDEGSIQFDSTYVDSILEILLSGFRQLKRQNKVILDLVEEPGELELEIVGDNISIAYQQHVVLVEKITFLRDLKKSTDNLLKEIEDFSGSQKLPIFKNLIKLRAQLGT
jgi:hypothetical protein